MAMCRSPQGQNADSVRERLPWSSPLSARRSCSSVFSGGLLLLDG
jgi:hypothetical protein